MIEMSWRDLTNDELRRALRGIVNRSTSKEQVMRRAKDELGYPYNIAVTYSAPNAAGQRMSMFMASAKDGETLT